VRAFALAAMDRNFRPVVGLALTEPEWDCLPVMALPLFAMVWEGCPVRALAWAEVNRNFRPVVALTLAEMEGDHLPVGKLAVAAME